MSNLMRYVIVLGISLFVADSAYAQCSDAGACAISYGASASQNKVGLSYIFGSSGKPDDLRFHTVRLEGEFGLFDHSLISVELPYSSQSGPLGNTSGLGDLVVVWNQRLVDDAPSQLSAHLGAKLATGDNNANALPQSYQSTLGTNDILIGLSYFYDDWNAAVVYQFSRGRSNNAITGLRRGDDLLVRAGYRFAVEQVHFLAELLAVKRLEQSSVLNSATPVSNDYNDIPNSDQFQLNVQGTLQYSLSENYNLQLSTAMPLLKRDVNVDGLKRSFTLSVGLSHLF